MAHETARAPPDATTRGTSLQNALTLRNRHLASASANISTRLAPVSERGDRRSRRRRRLPGSTTTTSADFQSGGVTGGARGGRPGRHDRGRQRWRRDVENAKRERRRIEKADGKKNRPPRVRPRSTDPARHPPSRDPPATPSLVRPGEGGRSRGVWSPGAENPPPGTGAAVTNIRPRRQIT